MNKRYKQFWATIGGVGFLAVFFESFPSLMKSIDFFLQSKQLTIGAILMGMVPFFVVLSTIRKEADKRKRSRQIEVTQQRMERNQKKIMDHWGIEGEWSSPINGSESIRTPTLTMYYILSQVATILRRKKVMDKLKSRKMWLAIFGALFPVLNVELGINLDPNVVFGVMGVVVSGIAALAHVDGKKAQAVVKELKESVPIDPNATYKDMFPTIKEVHDKVNKFLSMAKTNDVNVLAVYPHLLELLTSYEHPIPVEVVVEDKVAI